MHAAVLRYFEAVAEDGSIRRASERLHISPSAVNRQILKIEDYFGTPLFERRPDGMRLTDAGQLVLHHARPRCMTSPGCAATSTTCAASSAAW